MPIDSLLLQGAAARLCRKCANRCKVTRLDFSASLKWTYAQISERHNRPFAADAETPSLRSHRIARCVNIFRSALQATGRRPAPIALADGVVERQLESFDDLWLIVAERKPFHDQRVR